MGNLRYFTAGESHGQCLIGIIEGVPAGLSLSNEDFLADLAQRQAGYGRGGRMQIEHDEAEVLSGVMGGYTTGAPITLRIENRDWPNWKDRKIPRWVVPRPGHVDLAGALKYGHSDLRIAAERASARETAMRVALGVIAKRLLALFGIQSISHVTAIGGAFASASRLPWEELCQRVKSSPFRCADPKGEAAMREAVDEARQQGESLGGVFEVVVDGVPPGLGSHVHWDRRLDGRLAQALMSIQGIKGVEVGAGFATASRPGTRVQDEILTDLKRRTNRAGGIEGGISNGEQIVLRAAMKPIPTTITPVTSVDLDTGLATKTQYQRSDVCAVPAASMVGESVTALVLADSLLEKFGGDNITETKLNLDNFLASIAHWCKP
jgi:chorismate synthase